jgi:crotonobetainyl-CoA:carnitine CoA-transferase CaiB-like acyl-CoA transferase
MVSKQVEEAEPLALAGVRVLDLSLQLPGPYASWLLHGLGADVVSVEPPGGDPVRVLDPAMYALLSEGKAVSALDLRSAAGRTEFESLARECDVFIEGFRPGVAQRLGFAYAEISALRPGVIYGSISGYGQEGPYRDIAGHDLNYLGVAGAEELGDRTGGPRPQSVPIVDLATGTTAALAIVAALRRRDQTGLGCYLDLAMLDIAVAWANVKPGTTEPEAAYGVFTAADGRCLSLGVLEDKFWNALCRVMGWEEWSGDPALATPADRQARAYDIDARVRGRIAERPRDAWLRRFAEADVPAAPVHAPHEVPSDPQVHLRKLFADGRLRVPLPGVLARQPAGERR